MHNTGCSGGRDKTCPARTYLIVSWKAILLLYRVIIIMLLLSYSVMIIVIIINIITVSILNYHYH